MSREVLQQALEALEGSISLTMDKIAQRHEAVTAIEAALAQPEQDYPKDFIHALAFHTALSDLEPEQEPVAWMLGDDDFQDARCYVGVDGDIPLFTSPPRRQPDDNGITVDLLERFKAILTRLGYATPEGGLEQFGARLPTQLYNLCRAADSLLEEALVTKNVSLPEQEPVAFYNPQHGGFYWAKPTTIHAPQAVDIVPLALYTSPPQRQPLTPEQVDEIVDTYTTSDHGYDIWTDGKAVARAVEKAHGIGDKT